MSPCHSYDDGCVSNVDGNRCSDSELPGHIRPASPPPSPVARLALPHPTLDKELMHGGLLLDTAAGLWPDLTAFPAFRDVKVGDSALTLNSKN
jgi:hypothetical protein